MTKTATKKNKKITLAQARTIAQEAAKKADANKWKEEASSSPPTKEKKKEEKPPAVVETDYHGLKDSKAGIAPHAGILTVGYKPRTIHTTSDGSGINHPHQDSNLLFHLDEDLKIVAVDLLFADDMPATYWLTKHPDRNLIPPAILGAMDGWFISNNNKATTTTKKK